MPFRNIQKKVLKNGQKLREGTDRALRDRYRGFDEKVPVVDFLRQVHGLEGPINIEEMSISHNDPPDIGYLSGQGWWGFEVTVVNSQIVENHLSEGGKILATMRETVSDWMDITAFQNVAVCDPIEFKDDIQDTIATKGREIKRWNTKSRKCHNKILLILMYLPLTSLLEGHHSLLLIPHDEFHKHTFPDRGFFCKYKYKSHGFDKIYLDYGYEPGLEQVYERIRFCLWDSIILTIGNIFRYLNLIIFWH